MTQVLVPVSDASAAATAGGTNDGHEAYSGREATADLVLWLNCRISVAKLEPVADVRQRKTPKSVWWV